MEIIAEFGCNWKTIKDFETMVLLCKTLNIKFVKMQMWKKDKVPKEVRSMYIGKGRAKHCFKFAKKHGIELFYSVFYPEAIDICEGIGVNFYKVRFYDRNNLTLYRRLKKIKQGKKVFVSCQDPMDTLYYNMAKYQKNVIFLYCVPRYPAKIENYLIKDLKIWNGIKGVSDHTSNVDLLKIALKNPYIKWFEMHVKMGNDCYENLWSKSFEQIKEVL